MLKYFVAYRHDSWFFLLSRTTITFQIAIPCTSATLILNFYFNTLGITLRVLYINPHAYCLNFHQFLGWSFVDIRAATSKCLSCEKEQHFSFKINPNDTCTLKYKSTKCLSLNLLSTTWDSVCIRSKKI